MNSLSPCGYDAGISNTDRPTRRVSRRGDELEAHFGQLPCRMGEQLERDADSSQATKKVDRSLLSADARE